MLRTAGDRGPVNLGTLTVVADDGTPVDWDRTDEHGNYAVVLPGPGRYVTVAAHAKWRPVSEVLDLPGTPVPHDIHFNQRLALSGRVTHHGRPVGSALILLVPVQGNALATRSARDGSYVLALPAPGRYILSVAERGGSTHTRLVVLPAPDTVIDVELGSRPPRTGLRV